MRGSLFLLAGLLFLQPVPPAFAQRTETKPPDWAKPMRAVHARFTGKPGTLALFGDSITISMAFWAPLRGEPKNMPPRMAAAHKLVKRSMNPDCWAKWRGPKFGNNGSMTIRWARENVDTWLKSHNPEVAVIMFGSNDLTQLKVAEFEKKTAEVVERCLKNGTVVLLTTLPPRSGLLERSKQFAEAVRRVAKRNKVPLIDYQAEILKRRPQDWDGRLPKFKKVEGSYDVPTLISRDGVHPSNPKAHRDFSETSLSRNGFLLRNYLTLLAYADVIRTVLRGNAKPKGAARSSRIETEPVRFVSARAAKTPAIKRPILFNTPEADAILSGLKVFPADNAFNQPVDRWPLHPNSKNIIASIGRDKPLRYNADMGFVLVPPDQKRVPVKIVEYPGESDKGPFPVPDVIPIEGWPVGYQRRKGKRMTLAEVQRRPAKYTGDRHAIVVDPVNRMLYEFFTFGKTADGWAAGQASVFDLKTNKLRPKGWTSADAAGLPIFPAVVRYDELKRGLVKHAMRVTVRRTRRAYVHPATHYASRLRDTNLPRMGERLRLRADFDVRRFSPPVQAILKGLKKYGMFVADNGIDWAISVTPDPRIPVLHEELRKIKGSDFEVVVAPK